ncbi:putative nuclease HARBI1 [Temnothorax longispinosus]|uniref:putative nuclease HARBI1 n=1 Tax=Temnothorax longispinosus TaxID=300112 RepID=UPI003A9A001F
MELAYILSSSEDEEFENIMYRRPKVIRRRPLYFEEYDDIDFHARFRLSKESVTAVLAEIEQEISYKIEQNNVISPMKQLLLTLRFYATGSHLLSAGDYSGVSKTSSHRIIHRVTAAIARLRPRYIKFPMLAEEIKREQMKFFDIARFPRVIGCIDCTHIKVQSFGGNDAEYFRNRKGYFSVNVQAVCNANLEITDLVARWQGSVHDATIFNNSRIRALFEAGTFQNSLLLGDGGYAVRSYFMTPLQNPRTRAEHLYNKSHIRTRNTIERVFGIWKKRFPILALGSRFQKVDKVLLVIIATAVLHNIARRAGDPVPANDPELVLPAPWENLLQEGNIAYRHDGPGNNGMQHATLTEKYY